MPTSDAAGTGGGTGAGAGTGSSLELTEEERVRIRAYHLWESAGRPDGQDAHFWEQARTHEREGGAAPSTTGEGGKSGEVRQPIGETMAETLAEVPAHD